MCSLGIIRKRNAQKITGNHCFVSKNILYHFWIICYIFSAAIAIEHFTGVKFLGCIIPHYFQHQKLTHKSASLGLPRPMLILRCNEQNKLKKRIKQKQWRNHKIAEIRSGERKWKRAFTVERSPNFQDRAEWEAEYLNFFPNEARFPPDLLLADLFLSPGQTTQA